MKTLPLALIAVFTLQAQSPAGAAARDFLRDEKVIWTSPLHLTKRQAVPVLVFSALTAALIATDRHAAAALPNTQDQVYVSNRISNGTLGLEGAFAGALLLAGNDPKKEAGMRLAAVLAHTFLVGEALKLATQRERPYQDEGRGRFWAGGRSFPSGHALIGFGLAEAIAGESHGRLWVRIAGYSLAAAISLSRIPARKHFPSDVLAGSAGGLLIGSYVWHSHRRVP